MTMMQICARGEVCWERPGCDGDHLCGATQPLLHGDHHLDHLDGDDGDDQEDWDYDENCDDDDGDLDQLFDI